MTRNLVAEARRCAADGLTLPQASELRPIPGFPGYSVTRCGRVWSDPKSYIKGQKHDGLWLSLRTPNGAPAIVALHRGRVRYRRSVRTLVRQAWGNQ